MSILRSFVELFKKNPLLGSCIYITTTASVTMVLLFIFPIVLNQSMKDELIPFVLFLCSLLFLPYMWYKILYSDKCFNNDQSENAKGNGN